MAERRRDLASNPEGNSVISSADAWTPVQAQEVSDTLSSWTDARLNELAKSSNLSQFATDDQFQQLTLDLTDAERDITIMLAAHGARVELGMYDKGDKPPFIAEPTAEDITIVEPYRVSIENHLATVASRQTASFSELINTQMQAAQQYWDSEAGQGSTVADLAKRIRESLMNTTGKKAADASEVGRRSMMIARTETLWSANKGLQEQAMQLGIVKQEWLATEDSLLCEYCAAMDGQVWIIGTAVIPEGEPFAGLAGGSYTPALPVESPPLHPNCRCLRVDILDVQDELDAAKRGADLAEWFKKRVESGEWKEDLKRRQKKLAQDRKRAEEAAEKSLTHTGCCGIYH